MYMLPAALRWTVLWILNWSRVAVQSETLQCSMSPAGALHQVHGLLETLQAGPGCASRESGNKETHVIAVGRPTHGNRVTVVLKPRTPHPAPDRKIAVLLISEQPLNWSLEVTGLDQPLTVLGQVSPANSTVASSTPALNLQLQRLPSPAPFPAHELLRWARQLHGAGPSSMTHAAQANRVYAALGEDLSAGQVCHLQPLFLSPHYMTSDLQQQDVRGCVPMLDSDQSGGAEVHVIQLDSAGSALCGSLQVEVVVSLVPPVADSGSHRVVLVLSSRVPVHWAVLAPGLHGDVSVHSSSSVSPPYPPQPRLSFSSVVTSELLAVPDALAWANGRDFTAVTSYTEASLANRFVVRLAGGRTEVGSVGRGAGSHALEEGQLRQWLRGGAGGGAKGAESLSVRCDDGRLNVMLDTHILETLSLPVVAVTLRDPKCTAKSNSSHFLLAFPVISCGTEGWLQQHPRGVQYKNTVFIWRDRPDTRTTGDIHTARPLGIHISCFSASPPDDDGLTTPRPPWGGPQEPGSGGWPRLPAPRPRAGPALVLRLFVSESYQKSRTGPCVVIADHRVYVEISSTGLVAGALELSSCVLSPVSDPQRSPFWPIIQDRCPSHPTLILNRLWGEGEEQGRHAGQKAVEGGGDGGGGGGGGEGGRGGVRAGGGDGEGVAGGGGKAEASGGVPREGGDAGIRGDGGGVEVPAGGETPHRDPSGENNQGSQGRRMILAREGEAEEAQSLRFSFVLRPIYNNSVQFLHCRLLLCSSGSSGEESQPVGRCRDGVPIPRLGSAPPSQQCEERNLSRPMVVTQPLSAVVGRPLAPPSGQRPVRPNVSQLSKASPDTSSSIMGLVPSIGILFTAFLMGVALMGSLWCIYTHTGTQTPLERIWCPCTRTWQQNGNHNNMSPSEQTDHSESPV